MEATVQALVTWYGVVAMVQVGWVVARDMYAGRKYFREGSKEACPLSFSSQKEITLLLHNDFHDSLLGGDWRIMSGSGKLY